MPDIPEHLTTTRSMDQYSRFLHTRFPDEHREYYREREGLVDKAISTGNVERQDIPSYQYIFEVIMVLLEEGQIGWARFWLLSYLAEWKMSMSIEGRFMEQLGTSKFEYTQKQDITEHIQSPKKKGLFGGK